MDEHQTKVYLEQLLNGAVPLTSAVGRKFTAEFEGGARVASSIADVTVFNKTLTITWSLGKTAAFRRTSTGANISFEGYGNSKKCMIE